ncbi:3-methyladenine DNA glycosylase [uncultured Campylobacter sp.]|uniref:3-methyladenine DNA glycosylase n=1 Tax=uncultured Campylobacter sp. TaxID=218934 RepID=UPI002623BD34|nr:3-methyladenine DNA glycosylase [uncultured Campylobacter sp.]
MNGYEIFKKLIALKLDFSNFDWLENSNLSEFEILLSIILTQNTNWNNVLKALSNLKKANINDFNALDNISKEDLALLIKPSGFYNTKSKRIKDFINSIKLDFKDFDDFKNRVDRQWLLSVKGLGFESADGILNYLCGREILVVDAYTNRLAKALGYEFESYDECREFFESGVEKNQEKLCKLLGKDYKLYELYQIFHALILSFVKMYSKGKSINSDGMNIIKDLN